MQPPAEQQGHTTVAELIKIDTTSGLISQVFGPSTQGSVPLSLSKASIFARPTDVPNLPDSVLEPLDGGVAVAAGILTTDFYASSKFVRPWTVPAAALPVFAMLPLGKPTLDLIPSFIVSSGMWRMETALSGTTWSGSHIMLSRSSPITQSNQVFSAQGMNTIFGGVRPAYYTNTVPESPYPVVTAATFAATMTSVELLFTTTTQQPRYSTSASAENCALMFPAANLAHFGSGYTCAWLTPSALSITLGASFTLRPDDTLTVLGDVIRSGSTLAEGQTPLYLPETDLLVITATTPVVPTVALTGYNTVGPCEGLTLSSAGSVHAGGLAFEYAWSITGTAAQQDKLAAIVSAAYGSRNSSIPFTATTSPLYAPTVTVPVGAMVELFGATGEETTTATFTLQLTTWFGKTSTTSFSVSRAASMLPQISIAGGTRVDVKPPRNVLVNALISRVGLCSGAIVRTDITYKWNQVLSDGEQTVNFTGSLASLRVRAYDLPARSAPYVFRVFVSDTDTTTGMTYNNSDTVNVYVTASPLRAVLTGGDKVHSSAVTLKLSASTSRDLDVNPTVSSQSLNLTYAWVCRDASNASVPCFPSSSGVTEPTTADWELPSMQLKKSQVTQMLFTVTVSKDSRNATATSTVTLVSEQKYSVTINVPDRAQMLQQNPIVLTAVVAKMSGPGTAASETEKPLPLWSCDTRNANIDEAGIVLFSGAFPSTDNSGNMVHTLTLAGEKLVAGIAYTFRLSLYPNNYTDTPTQAEIQDLPVGALPDELVSAHASFSINVPPRSGRCFAVFSNPEAITAMSNQPFTLQCSGWEDDDGDMPLTYHWYTESKRVLRDVVKSNWVEIGMALPSPTLSVTLLAGHVDDDYSRTVAVYITDVWGAQTRVEIVVPFAPPPESLKWHASPSLYAILEDSDAVQTEIETLFTELDDAVELSDITTVTQTVLRITDTLDSASVTAEENVVFRVRLLATVRNVATMFTISQDARRAVAALDESTRAAAANSTETMSDTNQFNKGSGYSEVAIELLTQLCGDGKHLNSDARTQVMQFLISQTSSLASLDAFNGMQTATADSALVTTQMVIDAFANEITGLNRNMTLNNATSDATVDGARMIALQNEAASIVNVIEQQMNVLAMGSIAQQAVGQEAAHTVKFAGLSVVSYAFATALAPSSMESQMPNTVDSGAEPVMARVTMPPSINSLNMSAMQVVMVMIEDSAIFNLAGMDANTYLNGSESSPLLAFTVFNRALSTVGEMTVGENVTVPAQQPIKFNLSGSSTVGYIMAGRPFATLAADAGEFFTLQVPHSAPTWPDVNFVCEWWDANADGVGGQWSTKGCKLVSVSSTNTTTTCQCTHLTLFRVRLDFNNFLPKFNTLDADDFKNLTWTNIKAHPLPLITCGVWFGAYLIFAFIAAMIDRRKDARALRHYHGEWSDPQRKQWDAVTGDTSASLPSSAMLNPDAGVEKMAFTERWIDFSRHLLKHDHLWLSVLLRYDTNAFSSVGRVTAGFVLVLTGYMINALFFGAADGSVGFSTIVTSLISAAILIPVGVLISLLFGRSQQGRLKSAIYGYAEHVAHLHYTNRISEPQYATRNENRMKRNPVVSDEDERMLLHSIAQAGGWTHGPGNALIAENARGTRNERELRNQLRLLVHIDYDLFMVWFRESWSFPLGLRLFGFVLLWAYVIVLVMLILVYGVQLDMDNSDNTMRWLQASAISNVIEIFALKPVSVCIKAFVMLVLSFCFCGGKPKGPASKSTPDDNLTIYNAIEMFSASGAGKGHKHVAADLALDIGAPEHATGFVAAATDYDDDNYATLQNSSSNFGNNSKHTPTAPAAVEMMALGGARAKYEAVHSTPASPVAAVPPPVPAAPYGYKDDYYDHNGAGNSNTHNGYNDDWSETHNEPEPVPVPVVVAMPPPPPPVALVPPPPPPHAVIVAPPLPPPVIVAPPPPPPVAAVQHPAPVRLVVPSPPLSSLHTAQRGETESLAPGHTPTVPALPAPSGGVPVMGTRSVLAYQEREASASVSESVATGTASPGALTRVPMPLPARIKAEYARQESFYDEP